MLDLHLNVHPETAHRLLKVLELYPDQERFAQNIIDYQITELKRGIFNLQLDLKAFEKQYQTTTQDFYQQFSDGKTDDREDYVLWAGLYEMWHKNQKQLQGLE